MGGVRVNVSLSITVTCAIAVSYLLPWVSVNYRGELVRRDRQKGGGRGGALLSLQNTIQIKRCLSTLFKSI